MAQKLGGNHPVVKCLPIQEIGEIQVLVKLSHNNLQQIMPVISQVLLDGVLQDQDQCKTLLAHHSKLEVPLAQLAGVNKDQINKPQPDGGMTNLIKIKPQCHQVVGTLLL